jgi:hypothetical protein
MSWLILEKPVWVLDQHLACHYYFTQDTYYARRRRVQRGHARHERVQRVLAQHGRVKCACVRRGCTWHERA